MPPWKNTSRFGHTSCIERAPAAFITSRITVRNHEGTPDMLVMLLFKLAATSAGSFSSQFSISATLLLGTRIMLAMGLMFLMSEAERSPI